MRARLPLERVPAGFGRVGFGAPGGEVDARAFLVVLVVRDARFVRRRPVREQRRRAGPRRAGRILANRGADSAPNRRACRLAPARPPAPRCGNGPPWRPSAPAGAPLACV